MSGFNRYVIRNHFRLQAKQKNAKRKRGAPRVMMGHLWRMADKVKYRIYGARRVVAWPSHKEAR